MGQCLSRKRTKGTVSFFYDEILECEPICINVLEYDEKSNHFIVHYRNAHAVRACGLDSISLFMTDTVRKNILSIVIGEGKSWKCIVSSNNVIEKMSNGVDAETVDTQYKLAQLAFHAQRPSLERTATNIRQTSWYEIYVCPFGDTKNHIIVSLYDVSKYINRTELLMCMTDHHLRLMQQVYPRHFLLRISDLGETNMEDFSNYHPQVTVMFADVTGFTNLCHVTPANVVMRFLSNLYSTFDNVLKGYPSLYKYEVAGDCYIIIGGLGKKDNVGFLSLDASFNQISSEKEVIRFANHLRETASSIMMPNGMGPVQLRIGIHTGPAMSGIIGTQNPRFMLVGDTMNTASRMESTCPPGKIQVTEVFYNCVKDVVLPSRATWMKTKGVNVKGKGIMDTYIITFDNNTPENLHEVKVWHRKDDNTKKSNELFYRADTSKPLSFITEVPFFLDNCASDESDNGKYYYSDSIIK